MFSTTKPVTPSSTISGTEPFPKAMTGVPVAIASISTRPNGSGHSIGNSRAAASPRNRLFSLSPISHKLDHRIVQERRDDLRKIFAVHRIDLSCHAQLCAGLPCNGDRPLGSLLRSDAAEKREVSAPPL